MINYSYNKNIKIKKALSIFLAILFVFTFFSLSKAYAAHTPSIGIQKTANAISIKAGSTVAYKIYITNIGNINAVGIVVTDNLPDGFTYTDTGLIARQWHYTSLAPGENKTITYDVKIADNAKDGTYMNIASIKGDNFSSITDKVEIVVRQFASPQILLATQNPTASNTTIVTPQTSNTSAVLTNENNGSEEPLGNSGISFYEIMLWLIAFAILSMSLYKLSRIKHEFNT